MDLFFMMPTTAFMTEKKNSSPASQYQTYIHLYFQLFPWMGTCRYMYVSTFLHLILLWKAFFFNNEIFFSFLVFWSLLNLLQLCFCFMFWFFGHESCGILALWPGALTPYTGRQSLNHWTARELPHLILSLMRYFWQLKVLYIQGVEFDALHCELVTTI